MSLLARGGYFTEERASQCCVFNRCYNTQYSFTFSYPDHESALRWCWLMMTLVVPMVSGNAPNIDYSHNMRILKLPKSLNPGTQIYRLKGSHPDAKALTFGVREAFARRLLEIKSAGFRTADVYLRAPLVVSSYFRTIDLDSFCVSLYGLELSISCSLPCLHCMFDGFDSIMCRIEYCFLFIFCSSLYRYSRVG